MGGKPLGPCKRHGGGAERGAEALGVGDGGGGKVGRRGVPVRVRDPR